MNDHLLWRDLHTECGADCAVLYVNEQEAIIYLAVTAENRERVNAISQRHGGKEPLAIGDRLQTFAGRTVIVSAQRKD